MSLVLASLSTLENLYIEESPYSRSGRQDNTENELRLELLHPFSVAKNLYLSTRVAPPIITPLQELVGGRAMEVLPTLKPIFWRSSSHRDLSKRAFSSSLPCDKSSVTP